MIYIYKIKMPLCNILYELVNLIAMTKQLNLFIPSVKNILSHVYGKKNSKYCTGLKRYQKYPIKLQYLLLSSLY